MYSPIKHITCADGFTISVQATEHIYCSPRQNTGPWYEVECGFPSADVPELANYKDGNDADTDSVFGYVPVGIVEAVLAKHGGFQIPPDDVEQCSALISRITGAKHD